VEVLASFRHAWVLLFLAVPLALVAWTWNRRGRALVLPLDHGQQGRARGPRVLAALVKMAESLPALVLAAVIVLLAGPTRFDEPRSVRSLTNIEFCVDVSGSMVARFGDGDRYEAAMTAINGFLERREGDAFGLTFFGNAVLHWVPLTTDVSAFRCAPPFMSPGKLPHWFNGTEIGKALLACRKVLTAREEGDRMIILVSDGYSADLGGGRDEEIGRLLRADGIVVYTVHVASSNVPDEVVNLTAATGGAVFAPGDPEGLRLVFEHIDRMQQTKLEKVQAESLDHLEPWALAGLALLGAGLLAGLGLRWTPW
jgi:Ca-activated chloride channel family protein